ncbi:amidohydrolase family protein [Brucella gallinifaecis]|uniref:2-pyrone-4,6-dicarboxylate hydrolase n=1 Tax=Brucella gallinifaecis TaxID=215590 RepID=A0A502BN17_9HYPH|nr:amidohydrolase family protein [Brucella gallinifaecis]TPF74686.1 2-pyrone-4,6-dicarboxylate hydrolase [Brucella gallinifaecis]
MSDYFPFDPEPRRPSNKAPAGSCDSQFHPFGDPLKYPVRQGAAYEMPDATIDEALRMHRTLGIERGVIVQSTTYGSDNRILLDALEVAGPEYRGCTVAASLSLSDTEIERLNSAGVRGARFNFLSSVNLVTSADSFSRSVDRARELGWYIKIQPSENGITDALSQISDIDIPVIIDHMGRPDMTNGPESETVLATEELLKRGNFWVMLSNGHKFSRSGAPWNDVVPIAQRYIAAAPDRVLWATDWPHPLSKKQPPNDGDLFDLLFRYAPDAQQRQKILVDNPAYLFGFNKMAEVTP